MSVIRTFFRHCPSCGRRFEIRLLNKKLMKEERVTTMLTPSESNTRSELMAGPATGTTAPLIVGVGFPVTIDVDSFQYSYKCKHCGHQWAEVHEEEHGES
jgi:DNA-directed RNA polymerase subunit RPC12/RpoP